MQVSLSLALYMLVLLSIRCMIGWTGLEPHLSSFASDGKTKKFLWYGMPSMSMVLSRAMDGDGSYIHAERQVFVNYMHQITNWMGQVVYGRIRS